VSAEVLAQVRRELRERLLERVDARGLVAAPRTERRVRVREEALDVLRESGVILPQRDLANVVNEVSDAVVGFGPIEFLLKDPEVTEVMVNGADDVFVERRGRIERAPGGLFEGEEAVVHLIERIVGPLGLRVDESSPWADARLPEGSRVHAIIPPLSLRGPVLTIRKFSPVPITAEGLVADGSAGPRMMRFLAACILGRMNIVVSGGAGSGKTTLLGILCGFIPDHERLLTIEDAAELRIQKPHVVSLEARPANVEGRGEVTVRDLVRNALRMRPDRIIVGEVRGGEALDMLQAMNTGHDGSLSTAHANPSVEATYPGSLPQSVLAQYAAASRPSSMNCSASSRVTNLGAMTLRSGTVKSTYRHQSLLRCARDASCFHAPKSAHPPIRSTRESQRSILPG
jgi:pilus assembly protein CpaF